MKTYKVERDHENMRLDRFVKHYVNKCLVQSFIEKACRNGAIKLNSNKVKTNDRVKVGDDVACAEYVVDQAQLQTTRRKKTPKINNIFVSRVKNSIIFKDENIIAINKPYDIAVQGGTNITVSICDVFDNIKLSDTDDLKIVHRIDKTTTGVLLIARNRMVAERLAELFKSGDLQKRYIGLVHGKVAKAMPVDKDIEVEGKFYAAQTTIMPMKSNENASLVEFDIKTGRKHQIRIHSASVGFPLIGDKRYGCRRQQNPQHQQNGEQKFPELYLHANEIKFELLGKKYHIKAEVPKSFMQAMVKLGLSYTFKK